MVERLTPSRRAMEETLFSGRVSRFRACRTCSEVMAGGRPTRRTRREPPRPGSVYQTNAGSLVPLTELFRVTADLSRPGSAPETEAWSEAGVQRNRSALRWTW
ncbi:hypothetical protein [Nonomuraea sp. NPDC049695]|uniref:hypothetical protein n=1 Tax=Nonomuraea sp. NPDC049695 TaxID=3154734 RepID=UPI00343FD71A